MGVSRCLAAPGLRTRSRLGWRAGVSSALAIVAGQPTLWLLGAVGFVLRGGLLPLLAAAVVLPTPVELRIAVGSNLGSTGLTPGFVTLLASAGAVIVVVILAALIAGAYVELVAFERLARDPESIGQRAGRAPVALTPIVRRGTVVGLFVLQLGALSVLTIAALPVVNGVIELTHSEVVRPSLGGTIYVRVFNGVLEPLFFLLTMFVLIEMVYSVASRRLLTRAFGLGRGQPPSGVWAACRTLPALVAEAVARPVTRPMQTALNMLLAWSTSLVILAPAIWGIGTAWAAVRATYLERGSGTDVEAVSGLAVVTVAFAAIWAFGLLAAGFASALRAALWSTQALD